MRGRGNSYPPHGRHINDAFPGAVASPVQTVTDLSRDSNSISVVL